MKNRRGDLQRTDTELTLVKYVQDDSFSTSDESLCSESDSNNVSRSSQADASLLSRRSASAETLDSLLEAEEPLMSQCRRQQIPLVNGPTPNLPVRSGHRQCSRDRRTVSRSAGISYDSSSTPCLTRRCLVILAGLSLSFSALVACLTAFCLVYVLVPIYHEAYFMEGDYQNCFKCSSLDGINLTHGRDGPTCSGDHAELFCAQNSGQMSALFQYMMDKRKSSPVIPPAKTNKFRVGPVSAHNQLKADTGNDWSTPLDEGLQLVFRTRSSSGDPNHSNLVTTTNGSYVIQVTGLYLLYASVTIKSNSNACRRASNKTFRMSIMRRSAGSAPRLSVASMLASAEHRCCHTCNFQERHSLHTAGLFHLNETDEAFVYVKGTSFILSENQESHFGIILYRAAAS